MRALLLGLMLLSSSAGAETPKERAERLMTAKASSILPHWYRRTSKVSCVSYCKDGITSSDFNLTAVDTRTDQSVELAIYCDDIPDEHQCGWGFRR